MQELSTGKCTINNVQCTIYNYGKRQNGRENKIQNSKVEMMIEKFCEYCGENPGSKPVNKIIWNGFYDKDTKQLVCFDCRANHYKAKSKTEFKGLYTEFPVHLIN